MKIQIFVYNTYYTVHSKQIDLLIRDLSSLLNQLKQYKFEYHRQWRRMIRVLDKTYYYYNPDRSLFYFPISTFVQCVGILREAGHQLDGNNIFFRKEIPISMFKNKMKSTYQLRDYQKLYLDILISESSPAYNLVDLKPGSGKTFIAMNAIIQLGMRTGIVVLPKYIEKWVDDVLLYSDIPREQIYVVQGSDSLFTLLEEEKIKYSIIIFSLRTLTLYYKLFETQQEVEYLPYEIFNRLGIGLLLSDESHQELSALSKVVMYSNVKKVIGLSATFLSNKKDESQFQEFLFPSKTRVSNLVKFDRYIDVIAVRYEIPKIVRLRDNMKQGYNHILYEQSLLKYSTLFTHYLDMINAYLEEGYLDSRQSDDRCLIFFSTIEACTRAHQYFQQKYPDLKVKRYIGEDEYSEMLQGEIIISTPGSSGTAIDFPQLTCVFNTVSIGSSKSNIQITGRLRKLENRETKYYYFYNRGNRHQVKLHRQREFAIQHMSRTYKIIDYLEPLLPYVKRSLSLFS